MTRSADAQGLSSARVRGGWKWWHGMAAGMVLMLSPGVAVVLVVLAAPVLFVLISDRSSSRSVGRTIALFSLAGAIEPVRALVTDGHDLQTAIQILCRPRTIPLAWLLAGCGWLADEVFCQVAIWTTNMRVAARRKMLETLMAELRQEWQIPQNATE